MNKIRNKLKIKFFYRWHRRIGVSAGVFIIWIASSGIILNHSIGLGLDKIAIRNTALANWYGFAVTLPVTVYNNENHWLATSKQQLILDGKLLNSSQSDTLGMVATSNMLVIANANSMLLLGQDGSLIDSLNNHDLPVLEIHKLGIGCNGFVIQDKTKVFVSNDGLSWSRCEQSVDWSTAQPINPSQLARAKKLLVPAISLDKLLLDLHTGVFFGRVGRAVVDIIGICLLLLAISGTWIFIRQKRR